MDRLWLIFLSYLFGRWLAIIWISLVAVSAIAQAKVNWYINGIAFPIMDGLRQWFSTPMPQTGHHKLAQLTNHRSCGFRRRRDVYHQTCLGA